MSFLPQLDVSSIFTNSSILLRADCSSSTARLPLLPKRLLLERRPPKFRRAEPMSAKPTAPATAVRAAPPMMALAPPKTNAMLICKGEVGHGPGSSDHSYTYPHLSSPLLRHQCVVLEQFP
ncbi:hypothetical protein Hamer_G023772 [Homarus americanus]|uniref:Uncharacterized protein n=1 Tax=Homarus americanus TaxID=6706 RepID=A0A8J5JIX0_HOMAM|nr:hypothetical protein Hamer_G023772 [Homarus americanus]